MDQAQRLALLAAALAVAANSSAFCGFYVARSLPCRQDLVARRNRTEEHWHRLGHVDKFEPLIGCGRREHVEEGLGKLAIARGDGAVDFQMAGDTLDPVALATKPFVVADRNRPV